MNNNNKKKYIEPEMIETVLECEDIITASANLSNKITDGTATYEAGSSYVNVGAKSWGDIYGN